MSTAAPAAPQRPWYTAVVAGMASYLDAGAIAGTATALVLYQAAFGFSSAQFGQLSALLTITIALGALIGGHLGDRFGRRRVFTVTMVLFVVGAVVLALAPSTAVLYAGIPLLGLAGGADLPVSLAIIAENAPADRRGRLVSFSHILWMFGVVTSIILGIVGGSMGATGARIIFGHLVVVALIVLVLRFGIPESAAWQAQHDADVADVDEGRVSLSAARELFTRYLTPLVALGSFYAIANIAANTNGQFSTYLYVHAAGASVPVASVAGLAGLIFVFVGMTILMRLVDGSRRLLVFTIGSVLATVAFALPIVLGASVPTMLLGSVLYALGGAVAGEPMFKVWAQELFPTRLRSSAQGVMIAATRAVAAVVALVTPSLLSAYGASAVFGLLIVTNAAAGLIGLFGVARLPRKDDTVVAPEPAAARQTA